MKLHRIFYKLAILLISTFSLDGFAQSTRSSYFMKTSYMRTSMNPALRPDQGYIGIPFLSNIYLNAETNTFNLNNLTFPLIGERVTFMHAAIPDDKALSNISENNHVTSQITWTIFSMGFFKGESYWNIDLRARATLDVNVPRSLFQLLKVGFSENETVTHDLANIGATENAFTEIGVTNSRPFFNNSLVIGVRAKFLTGFSNLDLDAKSLNITAGREYWRAKSEVILKGAGSRISGRYKQDEDNPAKQAFDGFDYSGFSIPGLGLGIDIGGEYSFKNVPIEPLKRLKISYALNDIGFIHWSKDNSTRMNSPESEVIVTPTDYTLSNSNSIRDIFDNAIDDLKEAINLYEVPISRGYMTGLRANMNTGVEYEFWKNKMTAGFLYSVRFGNYSTSKEFTFSGNYKPTSWFATTLSYSFEHKIYNNIGLAVNLAPSKGVNLFLASDYMIVHISPQFIPTTSKALNFQMGISIPMGGKR